MSNINWSKYSYCEEELRIAIETSLSYRQTLLKLGLKGEGAGYKTVRRLIKILEIDTSHFVGRGHLRGKSHKWNSILTLREILVVNSTYMNNNNLKKKLFQANLLKNCCYVCDITTWKNKPLSLHLDHINGINHDNRIENLRLLCPNCHSQTDTYAGRNMRKARENREKMKNGLIKKSFTRKRTKTCYDCSNLICTKSTRCKSCAAKHNNKNW